MGQDVILKKECTHCYSRNKYYQRTHRFKQRHSRSFHGGKLKLLSEVAERHKARKQYGEGKSHRDHADGCIEKKLPYHRYFKTLPDEIVDIFPKELHEHDEEHNEKGHCEKWKKTFEDKAI